MFFSPSTLPSSCLSFSLTLKYSSLISSSEETRAASDRAEDGAPTKLFLKIQNNKPLPGNAWFFFERSQEKIIREFFEFNSVPTQKLTG